MTLPASGPISLSDVNVELGRATTAPISLNDAVVRALAGIPSGPISMNDLHGKSNWSWARPSTYSITGVAGGSVTSPTNAYDGSGTGIDGSTAAVVTHGNSGVWPTTESITYSGFGSGTHTGHIYIAFSGTLTDTGLDAYSSLEVFVNGSSIFSTTSTDSPSYLGGSALSQALTNQNLATLSVTISATGGRDGPQIDGDSCIATANVYDILFK